MAQLLVCTVLCLLHLAIGLGIGIKLRKISAITIVASQDTASHFVRAEVHQLAQDWAEIRRRLDLFLLAAERVQPLPNALLCGSLSELTQVRERLCNAVHNGVAESYTRDVGPNQALPQQEFLSNAQITLMFDLDREAEAAKVRHKFTVKQPMAPIVDDKPPAPDTFRLIQCHDLSAKEIRFFDADRPTADFILVGLGQPSPSKWLVAEILDYRIVVMYGRTGYLVTAQFRLCSDTPCQQSDVASIGD